MDILIKNINSSDDAYTFIDKQSVDTLEKIIVYCQDKFFNDISIVSDAIYDMLIDFLQLKSPKSKVLKKIGAPVKSKDKVKLPYYLGSMDKIKPPSNKLDSWMNEYKAPYILMDKLDGVSGLLVYSNNMILYTRGTATYGMNITPLLNYISIPTYETIMTYFPGHKTVAFRGELVLSKTKFDSKWVSTMKNSRNAISGLVNSKKIDPNLAHDTDFVVYQIVDPLYKMSEQLTTIKKLGFKTVHGKIIPKEKLTFDYLSQYLLKRRSESKYTIDGIIVTNDSINPINTNGNPEYSFAFKDVLEDQKALSTVESIEWNESKDGYLIPTILIAPVDIGGVTIKRVTGNNAKFIVDNNIGVGSKVEIIRSNDVIPKIEKVISKVKPILPKGTWQWSESGVHIISTDKNSVDMKIKTIYHFFSTLDTVGLGEKNIEKIYKSGYDSIEKFLLLTKINLLTIDGFKEKSADNIVSAIKKATTNIPLAKFMVASNKLGHGFGIERAKSIVNLHNDILNKKYSKLSEQQFVDMIKEIEGFEEIISRMFVTNYNKFIDFYESIKKYIIIDTSIKVSTGFKFMGMRIVMSGFRDAELAQKIGQQSGIIVSTISKNTDILIIKDESVSTTTKVKSAKALGIKIYTIEEFKSHFGL
jgi:DNA ligase (NAD+)